MFNTLKNAWRIPDLRKKLLYTLLIIIAFRFGSVVPVPFLNVSALNTLMASANETALGYINMLTGGAFANATLFAMGITPYINSSIIIQLLTVAIPALPFRHWKKCIEMEKKAERKLLPLRDTPRWVSASFRVPLIIST